MIKIRQYKQSNNDLIPRSNNPAHIRRYQFPSKPEDKRLNDQAHTLRVLGHSSLKIKDQTSRTYAKRIDSLKDLKSKSLSLKEAKSIGKNYL